MPKSNQIRVMISSRCKAKMSYKGKSVEISDLREVIKEKITELVLWPNQEPIFECWINENSASSSLNETWWERSRKEARDADVVIVLYNGESGGAVKKEPMGICHAELEAALDVQSKKVRGVRLLPLATLPKDALQRSADEAFRAYVDNLDIFGPAATTGEELIERAYNEVRQALVDLVQDAAVTPDLAKSNTGPALLWHRMSYLRRRDAMRNEISKALTDRGSEPENFDPTEGEWMTSWVTIAGQKLLTPLHAIPAALSQSAAREKVGQPFLQDYMLHEALADGDGGPMHIVACYKGVTESQALKMLGFPDAIVVPGEFGLHVADPVQKIQFVLLKNCQSPTATRGALTAWLAWLQRSAEDKDVAKRAAARKRIIAAIVEP